MSPDAHQDFRLVRDAHGGLEVHLPGGQRHADVVPVRAFPLSAPDQGLSLVGRDGHEIAWVDSLEQLEPASRALIEALLDERDIAPRIERIVSVSTYTTPSEWRVLTDRGAAVLTLRAEEDIRRLGAGALLIADRYGLSFRIDDVASLDAASRRLLDRFL